VHIFNNPDKFGYYQVGQLKFYSKLEAIYTADKLNLPPKWHFNDAEFAAHNWTVEPEQTLSELYRQRAEQLRDKYDYLVLWYSGGADSANILDTFVNNGIKLDECASIVNYAATGDKNDWLNGEIYNVAVPTVEAIPGLRHRLVDIAQFTVDCFNDKSMEDWTYSLNTFLNPNSMVKQDLKFRVPEWVKLMDEGKKVGFIYGVDKPRVFWTAKGYCLHFADAIDNAVGNRIQTQNDPRDHNELFYLDPDCATMLIKQAHVVKNFMKTVSSPTEHVSTNRADNIFRNFTVVDRKVHWLDLPLVNQLIYPTWKPVPYQVKPASLVFSPRDEWFFKLPDSDPAKRAWRMGVENMWNSVSDKRKRKNVAQGLTTIYSTVYNLGL
jgi:hypothetical protein